LLYEHSWHLKIVSLNASNRSQSFQFLCSFLMTTAKRGDMTLLHDASLSGQTLQWIPTLWT
jgi:hypothetical protein